MTKENSVQKITPVWHLIDRGPKNNKSVRYIHVNYSSLKQAILERADLLKFYPADSEWRKRLVIRCPDGVLYNPDFDSDPKKL
jgi:hypothetical protein